MIQYHCNVFLFKTYVVGTQRKSYVTAKLFSLSQRYRNITIGDRNGSYQELSLFKLLPESK